MPEYTLTHHKGDTFVYRGVIRYDTVPRALLTNEDILEFSISADDNLPGIILKTVGNGIEVDDNGVFIVTILPTETERDTLPEAAYRYALRWTDGTAPTTTRYTVMQGDLNLIDTPYSLDA